MIDSFLMRAAIANDPGENRERELRRDRTVELSLISYHITCVCGDLLRSPFEMQSKAHDERILPGQLTHSVINNDINKLIQNPYHRD